MNFLLAGHDPFWYDTDFWSGIAFVGFAYILVRFGAKPLANALRNRQKGIEDKLRQVEDAQKVIRELRLRQEERKRQAKVEAAAMIEEAKRDAERTRKELVARAANEIELMKRRANREISLAQRKAIQDLADYATDLSFQFAHETLAQRLDAKRHARLISTALQEMADAGRRP